jgi:HlyD family secretion protein
MRASVIIIAASAVALGGGYYGYQRVSGGSQPQSYNTATVDRGTLVSTVTAIGTVEPILKVVVGSQVSGTVMRWHADFNQSVKQNEILAELDQDQIKATIAQRSAALAAAQAGAAEARARLTKAKLSLERIQRAYEQSSASDNELAIAKADEQEAGAAERAAQARIELAAAELRATEIQLDKTIIRSPIDGVIISRDVDAGQTVAASLSAPTLFTIANDLRNMRVSAAVSETDIGNVREGMAAEFQVDAHPKVRFRGSVTQVRYAETVVDNVVTYVTLIDAPNPDMLLRPGMTATIRFEIERSEDVLRVPNAALRFDPVKKQASQTGRWSKPQRAQAIKPRVYRLAANGLEEVELELGISDGTHTEVRGGELNAGDTLVTGWDLTAGQSRSRGARML